MILISKIIFPIQNNNYTKERNITHNENIIIIYVKQKNVTCCMQ